MNLSIYLFLLVNLLEFYKINYDVFTKIINFKLIVTICVK